MRRCLATVSVALLLLASAGTRIEAETFSSYTKQLIDLVGLFKKLDEATATQMTQNERYLLAKRMMRLSHAFYTLMIAKDAYAASLLRATSAHKLPPDYATKVDAIRHSLDCLGQQLNKDGFAIASIVGVNGPATEAALRKGLSVKVAGFDALVRDSMAMDPSNPELEADISRDTKAAHDAAEALYTESLRFAKVLDPDVAPPDTLLGCEPH